MTNTDTDPGPADRLFSRVQPSGPPRYHETYGTQGARRGPMGRLFYWWLDLTMHPNALLAFVFVLLGLPVFVLLGLIGCFTWLLAADLIPQRFFKGWRR